MVSASNRTMHALLPFLRITAGRGAKKNIVAVADQYTDLGCDVPEKAHAS
jgi:hypothetical protein